MFLGSSVFPENIFRLRNETAFFENGVIYFFWITPLSWKKLGKKKAFLKNTAFLEIFPKMRRFLKWHHFFEKFWKVAFFEKKRGFFEKLWKNGVCFWKKEVFFILFFGFFFYQVFCRGPFCLGVLAHGPFGLAVLVAFQPFCVNTFSRRNTLNLLCAKHLFL